MEKYLLHCTECRVEDDLKTALCPVCLTQQITNGKWKFLILFLLKDKPLRFTEIKKSIPKVTQAYLSSQLKEMVEDDLVIRKSYPEVPPKVEYFLSEEGQNLAKVVEGMQSWGKDYMQGRLPKC